MMVRAPVTGLIATVLACGGGGWEPPATTERDSAGVHLVENQGTPRPLPWLVGDAPVFDIGGEAAEPAYQLFRVARVLRTADGRVVVANGGSQELRFYDATGGFLGASGREGDGPGEFRQISGLFRYRGDSLLVNDAESRRLSVFDGHGAFGRRLALQSTAELPYSNVIGVLDDATLLGQGFVRTGEATPDGLRRFPNPLFHLDTAGALITAMGLFPGTEILYRAFPDGGFSADLPPFGRSTHYQAAGDRVYVTPNDSYEVQLYRPDGTLATVVRLAMDPRPVTEADMEAERERRLAAARSPQARERTAQILRDAPRPETLPAYSAIIVDDSLNLWVGEYVAGASAPRAWTVFDAGGRLLGTVPNPAGFTPDHIGHDFLLGRWRGELDVEHVRLYTLARKAR